MGSTNQEDDGKGGKYFLGRNLLKDVPTKEPIVKLIVDVSEFVQNDSKFLEKKVVIGKFMGKRFSRKEIDDWVL